MFAPNWTAKGEYMYIDLQNANYGSLFGVADLGLGVTLHTIKDGVNYRF